MTNQQNETKLDAATAQNAIDTMAALLQQAMAREVNLMMEINKLKTELAKVAKDIPKK